MGKQLDMQLAYSQAKMERTFNYKAFKLNFQFYTQG